MEEKKENVGVLFRKFHTCEAYVRQGKIAACITLLLEVLEKLSSAQLLNNEKETLINGIYTLQRALAAHKNFKEIFGPVTFNDTDIKTTYEFLKQLQAAHEEDLRDRMKSESSQDEPEKLDVNGIPGPDAEAIRERATAAIKYLDDGNVPKANETIDGIDEVISYITEHYNTLGIQFRKESDYENALQCFVKALSIYSMDEGLHYNMARVYYEVGNRGKARECLSKALDINPEFQEGQRFDDFLLKFNTL
ncbi:MAG TPA: tetratricopeptide repeat protein [Syntrophales bacterium]|nr:tetratricopeptide repeat protein [Syntrophales bacterium]